MRTAKLIIGLLCLVSARIAAQEPAWNASAIKECDRACLVGIMDGSSVTIPYGLGNGWTPGAGR
jgi:hypothetical protein